MLTETPPPRDTGRENAAPNSRLRGLIARITRVEVMVGAVIAGVMLVLILIEPNILEAPFENERTLLFTFGGTAIAAVVFLGLLWFRVPAAVRLIVLVVPFALVNWWLLSPYFIDDMVDEDFSTSISTELDTADEPSARTAPDVEDAGTTTSIETPPPVDSTDTEEGQPTTTSEPEPPEPTGPVLLGAGQFVGLAGHDGSGDAGIFQNPDGSLVLRFENFDIENGPDLEVYLVPGPDQTSLADGSIHLGALKGNIGDQNYELPTATELPAGAYTALVWCEAFDVEFVGATILT